MAGRKHAIRVQPARYALGRGVLLGHCRTLHSERTLVQQSFTVVLTISQRPPWFTMGDTARYSAGRFANLTHVKLLKQFLLLFPLLLDNLLPPQIALELAGAKRGLIITGGGSAVASSARSISHQCSIG